MQAQIHTGAFNRILGATKAFTSSNDNRPIMRYIRLEFSKETQSVTAIALDGYRMSVEHSVCVSVDEDFTAYIKPIKLPNLRTATIEVKDGELFIRCDGAIYGFKQPDGDFPIDWKNALETIENDTVQFKIGFNGELLLSALQAAKASSGGMLSKPVALEFRGAEKPITLRTGTNDIKVVLPVRMRD